MRGTHDGTDLPGTVPNPDRVSDVTVNWPVLCNQALEKLAAGVAGAHQDKDAATDGSSFVEKWLDGIRPEPGIDRHRIRMELIKRRIRISRGCAGNVPALGVKDCDEAKLPGTLHHGLQRSHPFRASLLEKR